ncbi:hypothetical protein [uncultured Mucilaginibacter sp.]|uniref:hypothetical protein n=1 Tax=uncultured Mucilaginibacter sp. TaxID=797541 RepID=UPI0025D9B0DC|nr:hypothetical protein [uncultured Mucilaginibacter sp.]
MLRLTIKKQLPDDREYQRLLEYCQGLVAQKPQTGLQALNEMIRKYMRYMQLRAAKVQVLDSVNQITFKYRNSADTYFYITKTILND